MAKAIPAETITTTFTWGIANLERETTDGDALQAQLDEQRQPTKAAGMPWQ